MILKGSQRAGGKALAAHLLNDRDNDHTELYEIRGLDAQSLNAAFLEMEAAAKGTRCKQPFFHVSFNPPPGVVMTLDQFDYAFKQVEEANGLQDQPRAVIFHEKEGRRHAHAVWSRIDTEKVRAVPLPHYKLKLNTVSKGLFQTFGLDMPKGFKNQRQADPLAYDLETWQQAKRLVEDPRDLKFIISHAARHSDSIKALMAALDRQGLYLAQGDKRGFVVVHHSGEPMSLARYSGMKTKEINAKFGDPSRLETVDRVRDMIRSRITDEIKARSQAVRDKQLPQMLKMRDSLLTLRRDHRQARKAMKDAHEIRWRKEERGRADRLRKGIMGLWDRLTGKRGKVSEFNRLEAAAGRLRDRQEWDDLVKDQMNQRLELQKSIREMKAAHKDQNQRLREEIAYRLDLGGEVIKAQFRENMQDVTQSQSLTDTEKETEKETVKRGGGRKLSRTMNQNVAGKAKDAGNDNPDAGGKGTGLGKNTLG